MNSQLMNILFLHGMGGGKNSSVPKALKRELSKMQFTKDGELCTIQVICETNDFDPEVASKQIAQCVETYQPSLVIAESMGGIHALGIQGIPHIYISPALNFDRATTCAQPLIALCNSLGIYYRKQRSANRQEIRGDHELLAKFRPMIKKYKEAILNSPQRDPSFAFFGKNDEFKLLGIVSIKEYERLFGASYEVHDGGHIFGAKNVKPKLIPKIVEMLGLEVVKKPHGRKKKQDKNIITMSNESNNVQQDSLKDLLWDAEQAKQRLAIRDRFTAGAVRTEVYKHNLKIFEAWKYVAPSGKVIQLPGTRQELLDATRVYREVVSAAEVPA